MEDLEDPRQPLLETAILVEEGRNVVVDRARALEVCRNKFARSPVVVARGEDTQLKSRGLEKPGFRS